MRNYKANMTRLKSGDIIKLCPIFGDTVGVVFSYHAEDSGQSGYEVDFPAGHTAVYVGKSQYTSQLIS